MKNIIATTILCAFAIFSENISAQSIETVQVGSQTWMTENLNVDRFRNGDLIPQANTLEEWAEASENQEPVWAYYDNDPANGAKYGKLYNGYAVKDPRGLVPEGWHIPSRTEWVILLHSLDSDQSSNSKLKEMSWLKNGFEGGYVRYHLWNYTFEDKGNLGYWWGSNEANSETLYRYSSGHTNPVETGPNNGYSVRVIRDYTKEKYSQRAGVVQTDSGLLYRVIEEGEGVRNLFGDINERRPTADDSVYLTYAGFLTDGTVFDSSHGRGAMHFPVNALLPGMTEGIQLMLHSAIYEFYIPAELAYGNSPPQHGPIMPGSDLLFYIHLWSIK